MAKTDNHNPGAKLMLRKYFLEKYNPNGTATIFDCCQGGGVMWNTIQKTHQIKSYWGVDLKAKKGRLKIDSIRILQQGLSQNIIDIDTYGSPWKHWFALLSKLEEPKTVFLTIGSTMFKGATDKAVLASLGCIFKKLKLPETFYGRLDEIGVKYALASAGHFAKITEAIESLSTGNARYIGIRLEPKQNGQQVQPLTVNKPQLKRN